MAKTNGKRNRWAGHALERVVMNLMKAAGFPHVVTSRSESRKRDSQGVDLMNTNELENGRLPYNIQCKCTTERPKYDLLLKGLPKVKNVINVIIHKYTVRSKASGATFQTRGHYAILDMDDFLALIKEREELKAKVKEQRELTSFAAKNLMEHDSVD